MSSLAITGVVMRSVLASLGAVTSGTARDDDSSTREVPRIAAPWYPNSPGSEPSAQSTMSPIGAPSDIARRVSADATGRVKAHRLPPGVDVQPRIDTAACAVALGCGVA